MPKQQDPKEPFSQKSIPSSVNKPKAQDGASLPLTQRPLPEEPSDEVLERIWAKIVERMELTPEQHMIRQLQTLQPPEPSDEVLERIWQKIDLSPRVSLLQAATIEPIP